MLKVFMLIIGIAFMLSCGSKGDIASGVMSSPVLATIYVDASATGNNDGTSWSNAYTDLQAAIDDGGSKATGNGVINIYLAVGTYTPSGWPNGGTNERDKHFALKNGVQIYGGYPSGGGSNATGEQSETILSGDIGVQGNNSDNVYHVFYHTQGSGLTTLAKLENVTISGGNANGGDNIRNQGGGMYNGGAPTLTDVTFTNNVAAGNGGAMYNQGDSNPTLTDVTFTSNQAFRGGGMANVISNPTLTDVTFINNAAKYGGGMSNVVSNPTLTDVTFTSNVGDIYGGFGGGVYNDNGKLTLDNCKFENNRANGQGGGVYNKNGSVLTLTNVTFTGNTASNSGGAIYSTADSASNFTNNELVVIDAVSSRDNGYYKE